MTQSARSRKVLSSERAVPGTLSCVLTLEAALAVPLFLFAALCLVYILEVHAIRTSVRMGAHAAAKETAEQMAAYPEAQTLGFSGRLVDAVGRERLDRSLVVGGSGGIHTGGTRKTGEDQLQVELEYELKLPFPQVLVDPITCREGFLVKIWTGYKEPGEGGEGQGEIVYVTEHGGVYHEDRGCSHLALSIQFLPADQLEDQRNAGGSKYKRCERCTTLPVAGGYYITDYGDRYHGSLSCSGLKRTVYAVPKEEVNGRGGCAKCT